MVWQILIAALISVLLLIVEHYWPWQSMIKQPLGKIVAYILGVLAIELPLTGLFITWKVWPALWAMWIVTFIGGAVVAAINNLDTYLENRTRMEISEREGELLRKKNGQTNG